MTFYMISVFFWGQSQHLPENHAEIGAGIKTHHQADFRHIQIRVRQKAAGLINPPVRNHLLDGAPCLLLKSTHEIGLA